MRWNDIVTEGSDFNCPNCDDYMGKAKEVDAKGTCSNCGASYTNPGGVQRARAGDEKFGRLVFTDVEVEDGTTQGTLKTSKGAVLGSLIQYGRLWDAYDGGKWGAYCSATKKRRTGFPDKKKAVEWIVRQTRTVMKQSVSEEQGTNIKMFGSVIPDWEVEADQGYAAMFQGDPMYAPAQVHYELGKFYVALSSEEIESFTTQADAEAYLQSIGYTTPDGWDDWRPQTPAGME